MLTANPDRNGVNGPDPGPLLALAPGLRETGWAVFDGLSIAATGVAGLKTSRKITPQDRIAHQLETLSAVAARWRPARAARSRATGANPLAHGLEQLDEALRQWADNLSIPLSDYTTQQVKAAIAGNPNASRDAQCHAIMLRMGLIGQSRATPEWEAIAVACHHLDLGSRQRGQ